MFVGRADTGRTKRVGSPAPDRREPFPSEERPRKPVLIGSVGRQVLQVDAQQVREFFLEFEQSGQLLDLLLHLGDLSVVALSCRLVDLALGNFLVAVALPKLALVALLAEAGQVGGVEPLTPQKCTEFSRFVAGVRFFKDAEFVGSGEASSGRFLDHLWIRELLALRRGCLRRLGVGLAIVVHVIENECVHGNEPSPP